MSWKSCAAFIMLGLYAWAVSAQGALALETNPKPLPIHNKGEASEKAASRISLNLSKGFEYIGKQEKQTCGYTGAGGGEAPGSSVRYYFYKKRSPGMPWKAVCLDICQPGIVDGGEVERGLFSCIEEVRLVCGHARTGGEKYDFRIFDSRHFFDDLDLDFAAGKTITLGGHSHGAGLGKITDKEEIITYIWYLEGTGNYDPLGGNALVSWEKVTELARRLTSSFEKDVSISGATSMDFVADCPKEEK